MTRHSTSLLCGNLVDGLPHDFLTETVAKPGRLGPAQNDKPMLNFFDLERFCSMTYKKNQRNLVERISKIDMDVIKCKKANARARLIRFQISRNFGKIEISENIKEANCKF